MMNQKTEGARKSYEFMADYYAQVTGGVNDTHLNWLEDCVLGIRKFFELIGEDVTRDGLRDTPYRVVRAQLEMLRGYWEDPAELFATFDADQYDEMIMLRNAPFVSLCEHHVLPFIGQAHIAYLPGDSGRIVGISKLARLLQVFARRLQVQERLGQQIAQALEKHLEPSGVGVIIEAQHLCMIARGVQAPGAVMSTSVMLGMFRDDDKLRGEFLQLAGKEKGVL